MPWHNITSLYGLKNMKINDVLQNKTTKYVAMSISKYPGTFGVKVHNAMIKYKNIDAEYFACTTDNLKETLDTVRKNEDILGCGISMPYKIEVISYLDEISEDAKKIGSVNTVLNNKGKLFGLNTDIFGVDWALNFAKGRIALLGDGGMSKVFQYRLKNKNYSLITRHNWIILNREKFDTIINATPIGMLTGESPVSNYEHEVAIDSVVKMTTFVKKSKNSINGIDMSLRQAAQQFSLYFGVLPDIDVMKDAVRDMYDN